MAVPPGDELLAGLAAGRDEAFAAVIARTTAAGRGTTTSRRAIWCSTCDNRHSRHHFRAGMLPAARRLGFFSALDCYDSNDLIAAADAPWNAPCSRRIAV
jgi:hypothetical protein